MVLGLEEGLVECATLCSKSWIILEFLSCKLILSLFANFRKFYIFPCQSSTYTTFHFLHFFSKVSSVEEPWAKCFAIHILKFEILQTTWKTKRHQNQLMKNWKLRVWCSLSTFFHVNCKISNSDMRTAKYLAQASCTEFTLITFAQFVI